MYAGIPKMFKQMIEGAEGLPEGPHKWHKLSLYTNLYEGEIAQVLSDAESRLAPNIVIGSYPQTDNPDANVVVWPYPFSTREYHLSHQPIDRCMCGLVHRSAGHGAEPRREARS